MTVEVVHWNPQRPIMRGPLGRLLPIRRPVDNFGDLLGPVIVSELVKRQSLREPDESRRLLGVGSIMRLSRDGDTVWGTGVNGKSLHQPWTTRSLDVRAVRGPLTRAFLVEKGFEVPEVYGDPGLLVGHLWSRDELAADYPRTPHVVVPNFHDMRGMRATGNVVSPQDPLFSVIGRIAAADFVVGSSLHAVIIAESLGIPARLFQSSTEPPFKYEDYYRGTGRTSFEIAASPAAALELGGEPFDGWDPSALLAAFPADLWSGSDSLIDD
jgi:pyruvyltransferase